MADLNLDGLLDLVVVNRRAPMEIWQNTTQVSGHFLSLLLQQDDPNSQAIGAFIEVDVPNLKLQTNELIIGGGHVSGQAGPAHFGLGQAKNAKLRVIWPDHSHSEWVEVDADQHLILSPSALPQGTKLTIIPF